MPRRRGRVSVCVPVPYCSSDNNRVHPWIPVSLPATLSVSLRSRRTSERLCVIKLLVAPLALSKPFWEDEFEKEKKENERVPSLTSASTSNTPPPFLLSIFPRVPSVPSLRSYATLPLQTRPPPLPFFPFLLLLLHHHLLLLLLLLLLLQSTFKLPSPPQSCG